MSAQLAFQFFQPSTSSAVGSHAPMLAPPVEEPDSQERTPGSGTNTSASSASSARASSSSRTSKAARGAGCARCGPVCKNSAITRKPWGLALQTSGPPTCGNESSLWPTPTATQYGSNRGGAAGRTGPVRLSLDAEAKRWATPGARDDRGPAGSGYMTKGKAQLPNQVGDTGKLNAEWVEALQGFPIGWTDVDFTPTRRKMRPGRTPIGPASIIYGPPEEVKLSTSGSRRARSKSASQTGAAE